jgi:hypothetical protein
MTADPAVKAVVEAFSQGVPMCDVAEVAVAAARPIIEAEVRERIAAEIESAGRAEVDFLGRTIENKADRYRAIGSEDAWKAAARIARGQT